MLHSYEERMRRRAKALLALRIATAVWLISLVYVATAYVWGVEFDSESAVGRFSIVAIIYSCFGLLPVLFTGMTYDSYDY